jgi:hypothetical protein
MGTLDLVLFIVLLVSGVTSWFWVRGIDYMKNNHPDYKGEDLFDEDLHSDDNITKTAGRDGWDDNLVHTEGGL